MDRAKLKQAERRFLARYPGGFGHPEMQAIGKKHRIAKLVESAQTGFKTAAFSDHQSVIESAVRLVGQSSMVSVFEKPAYRDYLRGLDAEGRRRFAQALKAQLHGDAAWGFAAMAELLGEAKLAKWPLLTVIPFYFRPDAEVFVKPTTAKGVIAVFELEGLAYSPKPSYAFYQTYRERIMAMKAALSAGLAPDNAAFCGFLMMSLEN